MWNRKHGHNLDWFLRTAAKGRHVKALDSKPVLLEVDDFYCAMFITCSTNFSNIHKYCKLHGMSDEETLDAVTILNTIARGIT